MRNYEFLNIQVDKDCPKKVKRIAEADKELLKPIQSIMNNRVSADFLQHGYKASESINYNLLD